MSSSRVTSSAAVSSVVPSATLSTASSAASSTSAISQPSSTASSSGSSSTSPLAAARASTTGSIVNSTQGTTARGISGGAIGGIVGGVIGGIVLIAILITWWKSTRGRGEKVPPPPKRDLSRTSMRQRHVHSTSMGGLSGYHSSIGNNHRRTSTYSTLLAPPRGSSTYNHSRHPSYHQTSPAVTPRNFAASDASSPIPVSGASSESHSVSTSAPHTPGLQSQLLPIDQQTGKPYLAPLDTRVGDNQESEGIEPRPVSVATAERGQPVISHPHKSDFVQSSSSPTMRQPPDAPYELSPAHSNIPSPHDSPQDSPHASSRGLSPRTSSASNLRSGGIGHRPLSMNSLGSGRYLHFGPAGGAPHQGRPVALEMPKRLGVVPDVNGDFFTGVGISQLQGSADLGLDELGRMRKTSNKQTFQVDYESSPTRATFHGRSNERLPTHRQVEGHGSFQQEKDPQLILDRELPH
ncbi:hypothetical protein L204_106180 [Cryptococcus depauperatus]